MDEAVTHFINTHQTDESVAQAVHVDANTLALNVQDDGGGRVAIMHSQAYSAALCRQVSVVDHVADGQWGEELLDSDCRLAALMAHITQQSRAQLQHPQHKVQTVRTDVDTSVILDSSMRLFSGQPLDEAPILEESGGQVIETHLAVASPIHSKQSKKSLPHKKRISRKLKKSNGSSTPQQVTSYDDIVVINCTEGGQQEEILPDNYVTAVQHPGLSSDTHEMTTHEVVRPLFICQLCGQFYGEEQLKFYQHLKNHYEPHNTIIIENPVSDLGIDKMTNTCIVDNVAILPDSIVELSLENSVPKSLHHNIDKHVLYTTSDKTLTYTTNKVQYSMASMEKVVNVATEAEKTDLYDTLEKLELYNCGKCNKTFRKQKQCEAHMREAHSAKYNLQLEDMAEFSEPEDLMEGIHVAVEDGGEHYEQTILPHLTVENGHAHQENTRSWYGACGAECSASARRYDACGAECSASARRYGACCGACGPAPRARSPEPQHLKVLKEEVLQRILDTEVTTDTGAFSDNIINEPPPPVAPPESPATVDSTTKTPADTKKKPLKKFECPQCGKVFHHRNSLLYHTLSHSGKQHVCRECGKGFYTVTALKIHKRVHNGDRPYKCEVCGRDFRQWSDLKYHKESIHSDQKMFKCDFCGKEFARKYSLNVHRRIHTGEKNYKCEYCNKTFRASSYRLSHMRTHTSDKPHKCPQCEKCFRAAADLRRHMLIHDKVRNRVNEQKTKKDIKEEKIPQETSEDKPTVKLELSVNKSPKKIAVASTTKSSSAQAKNTPKKSKPVKKSQTYKIIAPNITIDQIESNYTNNVQVFDTRQETYPKYKEDYQETGYIKEDLDSAFDKQIIGYKCLPEDRDFALLRPICRNNVLIDNVDIDKTDFRENTDGKMQVFTHVEKNKEFTNAIVPNSQVALNDMRHLEREVRNDINGETIENGFLERLTAMYNIPAVSL